MSTQESTLTPTDLQTAPTAFEYIHSENADDFLHKLREVALRKRKEHVGRPPLRWAFRGMASADWHLTPSALRDGSRLGYETGDYWLVNKVSGKASEQMIAELGAVRQFLFECDAIGLPVPGDSQAIRSPAYLRETFDAALAKQEWPPSNLLDLFAFAQHHGVPTRLLDFTSCYQRAAYFAASSSIASGAGDRFVVWAIDLDFLRAASRYYQRSSIVHVTAPSAQNQYLRAQKGFFLCAQRAESRELDEILKHMAAFCYAASSKGFGGIGSAWKAATIVTCPESQAEDVVATLDSLGVHEASIYPSYQNVLRRLERRRESIDEVGWPLISGQQPPVVPMSQEMEDWLDTHWGGDPNVI